MPVPDPHAPIDDSLAADPARQAEENIAEEAKEDAERYLALRKMQRESAQRIIDSRNALLAKIQEARRKVL